MLNLQPSFRPTLARCAAAAALLALSALAGAQDGVPPAEHGGVMSSTPIIAGAPLAYTPLQAASNPVQALLAGPQGASQPSATGQPAAADAVVWKLRADQQPWPLRYRDASTLNTLFLTLPSEQEARLLMPGASLDAAARTQRVLAKYFTDAIGMASQDGAHWQEMESVWLDNTAKQKQTLSATDAWQQYEFSREALAQATSFRQRLMDQGDAGLQKMVREVTTAIGQVNAVMNATQGYEQRTAWYNVMVKMKEGVGLYQMQAATARTNAQKAIDTFIAENPPVARPDGDAPTAPTPGSAAREQAAAAAQAQAPTVAAAPARQPASAVAPEKEQGNPFLGSIVLLGMAATVVFMFLKLRKSGKGPAGAPPAAQ